MIRKATSSSLMTKHIEQPTCSFRIRASEVGGRSLGGSRAGELPPYLQPDELRKAALFSRYLYSTIFLGGSPATQLSLFLSLLAVWHGMAWRGLAWQTDALGYGSAVVRPTPSNITYRLPSARPNCINILMQQVIGSTGATHSRPTRWTRRTGITATESMYLRRY